MLCSGCTFYRALTWPLNGRLIMKNLGAEVLGNSDLEDLQNAANFARQTDRFQIM